MLDSISSCEAFKATAVIAAKVGRVGSKVGHTSRDYLQDEAEVSGRSVLLSVVFGVVDVGLVKVDEAGEVSRALQNRQGEIHDGIRCLPRMYL